MSAQEELKLLRYCAGKEKVQLGSRQGLVLKGREGQPVWLLRRRKGRQKMCKQSRK